MASFLSALLLASSSLPIAATAAKKNPTLYFSVGSAITTIDPAMINDSYSDQVAINVQEGLLSRNKNGQISAGLAQKWHHSKDGKRWTFTLRKGLHWSNGDRLRASDFVFAWRRLLNPATHSQAAYKFSGIVNADNISSGKADPSKLGVLAKNDRTLIVTLDHPLPQFEMELAAPTFYAVDPAVVQRFGRHFGNSSDHQVYSGPFRLTGWNGTNNHYRLVKNRYYWDKKHVASSRIDESVVSDPVAVVGLYRRNRLDLAPLTTQQSVSANRNRKDFHNYPAGGVFYLEFNQTGRVKGLTNRNIRLALNYAIDRKAIADQLSSGMDKPATGLVPEGSGGLTSQGKDFAKTAAQRTAKYYKYDLSQARKLFRRGMKQEKLNSLTLNVEATAENPVSKPEVDYLQQSWQRLGRVHIREHFVPFQQRLQDQRNQNFDVMVGGWTSDYAEPTGYLTLFTTNGSNNDGRWSSSKYDAAFNRAMDQNALNHSARTKDEINAEVALAKDAGALPIYWSYSPSLVNSKLKGLQHFDPGNYLYFKYAHK